MDAHHASLVKSRPIIDYAAKTPECRVSRAYAPGYIAVPLPLGSSAFSKEQITDISRLFSLPRASEDTVSCCITVYNEGCETFDSSFRALLASIKYSQKLDKRTPATANRKYQVCVVVDGVSSMSPSLARYAEQMGLFAPEHMDCSAELHIFQTIANVDALLATNGKDAFGGDSHWDASRLEHDLVEVLFCVVPENGGKLNSHRWYFSLVCAVYEPLYCVQIDVGVCPQSSAIHSLTEKLLSNPSVAAAAARSVVAPPERPTDILRGWQYVSFLSERLVVWPIEVSIGYLSVLPGQMHILRWEALKFQKQPVGQSGKTVPMRSDRGVLENYFQNIQELDIFEANMYLAEDRVMGIDLVYGKSRSWDLEYAVDAEATVDESESWSELLKQRRRWICGALACKPYMIKRALATFANLQSSKERVKRVCSLLYFAVFMLIEWFGPAVGVGLYISLYSEASSLLSSNSNTELTLSSLFFVSMLIFSGQLLLSISGKVGPLVDKAISLTCVFQSFFLLILSVLVVSNASLASKESLIFFALFLAVHLVMLSVVFVKSTYHGCNTLKVLPAYMLSSIYTGFVLQTFAICNMNDTSWGTKGLSKPINRQWSKVHGYGSQLLFKVTVVSLFVGSNAAALYLINEFNTTFLVLSGILLLHITIGIMACVLLLKRMRARVSDSGVVTSMLCEYDKGE